MKLSHCKVIAIMSLIRTGLFVFCCLAGLACANKPTALLQLSWPEGFDIESPGDDNPYDNAHFTVPLGVNTFVFKRGSKRFAAVLNIASGGEIYVSLKESELVPVQDVQELR